MSFLRLLDRALSVFSHTLGYALAGAGWGSLAMLIVFLLSAGTPPFGVMVLFGLPLCGAVLGAIYGCDYGIRLTKEKNIERADESSSVEVRRD
jgi:hypothetical protein